VIIAVDKEGPEKWVWSPSVVVSGPITIPRTKEYVQLVRERMDLEEIPAAEVDDAFRDAGIRQGARLHQERWVTSPKAKNAFLGLWGLTA
jgi:hypothetical protein